MAKKQPTPESTPETDADQGLGDTGDLTLQMPGGGSTSSTTETDADPDDDLAPQIADRDATIAQLQAALADANAKLAAVQTVAAPLVQVETGPRIIGEDWSTKTSAEAAAAGVTKTVLCSDGYYVPAV